MRSHSCGAHSRERWRCEEILGGRRTSREPKWSLSKLSRHISCGPLWTELVSMWDAQLKGAQTNCQGPILSASSSWRIGVGTRHVPERKGRPNHSCRCVQTIVEHLAGPGLGLLTMQADVWVMAHEAYPKLFSPLVGRFEWCHIAAFLRHLFS